jgi:hypothetical protein
VRPDLGRGEDGREPRIIEKPPLRRAVDQRAMETKPLHRTFQLLGRLHRRGHRQMSEAGEAFRVARNRCRQRVVVIPREGDALAGRQQISARALDGKHLQGHA